jgi:CRISPR/Cas system-associated protein Cas10 (large subunit of type III CRISPR-Cas system)
LVDSQLQTLRICALLHDIGKPECWANRKPWSEHIHWTYEIVKASLGEEYAVASMRHHAGLSYPVEYNPQTELEKIICLADNFAAGADSREEPEHSAPYPKPPISLVHVLSDGSVVRRSFDEAKLAEASKVLQKKIKEVGVSVAEKPLEVYLKIFDLLASSELREIPTDTRRPLNDVSLWNHLKLTAAFATCIWMDGGYRGDAYDNYSFAILSGDADRISSYINVSRRLPDLNARSEKIKKATDKAAGLLAEMLGPECVIFAASGSFLALSPAGKAMDVLLKVKEEFKAFTERQVTITVNSVVVNGEEIMKDFGKVWERAQLGMHAKKGEREVSLPASVEEGADVCDVCHIHPWVFEDKFKMLPIDAAPRPERLCENCLRLRGEGKGVELDTLKDKTNFVALLKADGDDVGKVLRGDKFKKFGKANTASRLSTLSDLIHLTCESRLKAVVQEFGGETVFAGGDDVLAFVPGEKVLKAVEALASCFRDEMAGECSMSMGIAIFRCDLPVYVGLEAADRLLKKAKEEGKNKVAYCVIGGSGVTSSELEEVKPREWEKLNELLKVVEFMGKGDVSSSHLRIIASVATQSSQKAEVLVKYLMGNSRIGWADGKKFLSHLNSGVLAEAFFIYNIFKSDETC